MEVGGVEGTNRGDKGVGGMRRRVDKGGEGIV